MTIDRPIAAPSKDHGGNQDRFFLRDLRGKRSITLVVLAILPVILPFTILVGTGLYGLDFGYHWDEEFMLGKVQRSIETGILLPDRFYNYPSMTYWLSFLGSGLELIPALQASDAANQLGELVGGQQFGIRGLWIEKILSQANLLRVRGVFLFVSALSVIWVYLLQLVWRRSWIEALLASSILALSWQVAYHLRWIAPDAILMQFVALTILLAMLVRLRPEHGRTWLRLAAVAAGLACGTKYQAGLILVPVLLATYQSWDRKSIVRGLLALLLEVVLIFGFSYLITTPGTVLAPIEFIRDVYFEAQHYQSGHVNHTVSAGLEHLRLNLTFFSLDLFSQYDLIALLLFIFALLGIYGIISESRELALLFLSFPLLYLLMISLQKVMMLRNLLVLAPFMAILSARGVAFVWERLNRRILRLGLALIVSLALIVNGYWLVHAAETIYNRNSERFVSEAAAYIKAHPETNFFVSGRVWEDLTAIDNFQAPNVTRDPTEDANQALFYIREGFERAEQWPYSRRDVTITSFGPREVDFNYYVGWKGDDRILLMDMDTARKMGILVVK